MTFTYAVRKAGGIDLLWVGCGLGATAIALAIRVRSKRGTPSDTSRWTKSCAWLLALTWLGGIFDGRLGSTSHLLSAIWLVAAVLLFVAQRRATYAIVLTAIVGGLLVLAMAPEPQIDVREMHFQAGRALAQGLNPYDSIRVEDSSPLAAPGAMIEGYPYPPVALIGYSIGVWLGSDPRWTSLFAWALVLFCAALMTFRFPVDQQRLGSWLLLLLALQPGWPYILNFSWTEPLSLMLVAFALLHWDRRPAWAAVALGLLFASKPYFLLAGPLLFRPAEGRSNRRLIIATLTGLATLLPFALSDPHALWRSTVGVHAAMATRFDASNLAGLLASFHIDWQPAAALVAGVPLVASLWLRRYAGDAAGFALTLAVVLSATFMLGTQAFANYWFLVSNLLMLSVLARRTASTRP